MGRIARRLGLSPQIAWEGGWSFALKFIYTGLVFLSTVLMTRLMGAAGYGIYSFAYSLVMLLALPAQSGLPALIVRETARGMAQGQGGRVQGVWHWAGRIVATLSLALALIAGPPLILWRGGLSSAQGATIAWALALVPLIALGNVRGAALRGLKRIVAGQLPEFLIMPGLFLLLLMGIGVFVGQPMTPHLAMALQLPAALIAFIAGAWMLWRNTPLSVRQAQPTSEGRVWLVSSFLFALIASFQVVNKEVSTLILGLFDASDQVGIYRVAVQVSTLASFALQSINAVVAPRFADLYARGRMAHLQHLVTGSARVVLAFNLCLTAFFVLVGKAFFGFIFGPDFAASYPSLMILLVGQAVNSAVGSVGFLLNMTGHERDAARGVAAAAGTNITLNLLLVPLWGIEGAAAAAAISMIVQNALLWQAVRKRLGINSLALNIKKR